MDTIKIQFPSIIENIRIVESFIENTKEKFSIDDDIYGNILVAVTESVNNAITHGNKLNKNKNVYLSVEPEDSELRFVIEDEGEGFDHRDLPDPTDPENLMKTSGRGIYLMKHLSDEVIFSNNGKKVELVFYM
jgi:serine/threonine-protein kinase RsbW